MARTRPNGELTVLNDDIAIVAPGFDGTVDAAPPGTGEIPLADVTTPLDVALGRPDLVQRQHVVLLGRLVPELLRPGDVAGVERPGVFEVHVPAPDDGWAQFATVHDRDTGVVEWAFPLDRNELYLTEPRSDRDRFAISLAGPMPFDVEGTALWPVGRLVHKIIKIVAFRVGGRLGGAFARRWERKHHPYALWRVTNDNLSDPPQRRSPTDADWKELTFGPALLLVHGTISSVSTCFGSLPDKDVAELLGRYENRVLAFDHPTVSEDPRQNVRWLLKHLPERQRLDVDIACHSRGGLVSRVLAEDIAAAPSDRIRVRRIVFVATPHSGTVLVDAKRMEAFLNTYTQFLTAFPGNGVVDGFDALLELAKDLAAGVLDAQPGLRSMVPGGPFLQELNSGAGRSPDTRYYAVGSDYEPPDGALRAWAADRVADAAFDEGNDLVVPTEGEPDPVLRTRRLC